MQERYLDDRDPERPYPGMVLAGSLLAVCAAVETDVGGRRPGVYVSNPEDGRVEVVGRVLARVPLWPDDTHAALLDCGFPVWVEPRMLRCPMCRLGSVVTIRHRLAFRPLERSSALAVN